MTDHEETTKTLKKLNEAVFGDGNGNVGMKRKVDEMYPVTMDMKDFLQATTSTAKAVKVIAGFVAAIAIAIWTVVRLFKGQSPF